MNRSSFAKGVAAFAAGATALATVGVAGAQAQPYEAYAAAPPPPGYVNCKAQSHSNGLLGALIGAGVGAVVGSHVAANHHRSDGGVVGAGVGGLLGASVGSSSTNCSQLPPPPPPQAYAAPPPGAYAEAPPPPVAYAAPPAVAYAAPPPAYYAPPPGGVVMVYGYRGERFRVAGPIGPDGCGWAQRPVAGPYGVQPGWVRVCRGWHGRFRIVG